MQSEIDILVIGSLNADLVVNTPRFPEPGETLHGNAFQTHSGGKGANQAYAVASLGGKATMIGRVGCDPFGETLTNNLSSRGVDTTLIQQDPRAPTGTALITVAASGENQIIVVPGANAELTGQHLGDSESKAIQSAKYILLQLEIPRETVDKTIRQAGNSKTVVILDPAPATPLPLHWLLNIDYVTPNLSELSLLTERSLTDETPIADIVSAARTICEQGCPCVIVKLGSRGALRVNKTDSKRFRAKSIGVVDTTAAGDCFNAALAVQLSEGHCLDDALAFAVAAATLSVTSAGAQASMPTSAEVETFLGL